MSVTIQMRRDTAANWTATNPILYQGEFGIETDTDKLKFGDGVTHWNSLAYYAAGGLTNPMTTLGDLIYENGTPAPARLAGNTTATKQFLTQTGTGTVSASPGWAAIAAGDVPTLNQDTTGKSAKTDALNSATTVVNVSAATAPATGQVLTATDSSHATWQTPSAGLEAWQFSVDDTTYGAKGDGKVVGDVVTNATTTITSATAGFTAGDAGKHVMINGADGNATFPHVTTIASVTNSTTAVLTTACAASATNCQMVWGTDDTAAINAAVSAAKTYALANDYMAEVIFGAKIYVLATGPTQTGNGTTTITYNAQIPVPYPGTGTTIAETGRKLVFKLTGSGSSSYAQYWDSITPNVTGTSLVSMVTAPQTIDPTFGVQSVIGGPSEAAGFTGGSGVSVVNYANTHIQVTDIAVWCGMFTNETAFDFSYLATMYVDRSSAHIFSVPGFDGTPAGPLLKDVWSGAGITTKQGVGLRCPLGGNNVALDCPSFTVEGYTYGVHLADHFTCDRLTTVYTFIAGYIDLGAGNGTCHGISIQNFDCEATQGGIKVNAGGMQPVYINMDCETAAGSVAYDVSDSSNGLYGQINWTDPADNRSPVVVGGAHLKFVNNFLGPGHWATPPAIPATTVAQQNTSFRDAAVSVQGGTVTVIAVDGTTVATASNTTVIVPSGKNITLTYSVAPTWVWTLL